MTEIELEGQCGPYFFRKSSLKSLSLVTTSVASIASGSFWTAAASGQQSKLWVRRFMKEVCALLLMLLLPMLHLAPSFKTP
jgi:hypothetical protein